MVYPRNIRGDAPPSCWSTPLAARADFRGDTAGRQVVDAEAFRTSFLPFEWRQLGRTGITVFGAHYKSDVFASLAGRGQGRLSCQL